MGEGGRGQGPVDLGVNASIIDRVVPKVGAFIAHGGRSPVDWWAIPQEHRTQVAVRLLLSGCSQVVAIRLQVLLSGCNQVVGMRLQLGT